MIKRLVWAPATRKRFLLRTHSSDGQWESTKGGGRPLNLPSMLEHVCFDPPIREQYGGPRPALGKPFGPTNGRPTERSLWHTARPLKCRDVSAKNSPCPIRCFDGRMPAERPFLGVNKNKKKKKKPPAPLRALALQRECALSQTAPPCPRSAFLLQRFAKKLIPPHGATAAP